MPNILEIETYFHVCIESANNIMGKKISPEFSTEAEAKRFIKNNNLTSARIRKSAFF